MEYPRWRNSDIEPKEQQRRKETRVIKKAEMCGSGERSGLQIGVR